MFEVIDVDEALGQASAAVKDLLAHPAWAATDHDSLRLLRASQVLITQLTALQAGYARELSGRGFPATQARPA